MINANNAESGMVMAAPVGITSTKCAFTSGQLVRVRVAAVNADGAASLLCDPVKHTVP